MGDTKKGIRTAIFLGAGASKADGLPLQNELLREYFKVKRESRGQDADGITRELGHFLGLFFGADTGKNEIETTTLPGYEEVFGVIDSALDEREQPRRKLVGYDSGPIPWDEGHLKYLRGCLLHSMADIIIEKRHSEMNGRESVHAKLLMNLQKLGLIDEVAFITTNYDIIMDNVLLKGVECGDDLASGVVDYGVNIDRSLKGSWSRPGAHAVPLLKLHGSLNWLYCESCDTITTSEQLEGALFVIKDVPEREIRCCSNCKRPFDILVVPPAMHKDMSNKRLQQVWLTAEEMLKQVEQLVFCGYSFPDADMHVKYLLKRIETDRPSERALRITVVNNHEDKIQSEFDAEEDRYARFFKCEVNYTDKSFEDFAANPSEILSPPKK